MGVRGIHQNWVEESVSPRGPKGFIFGDSVRIGSIIFNVECTVVPISLRTLAEFMITCLFFREYE